MFSYPNPYPNPNPYPYPLTHLCTATLSFPVPSRQPLTANRFHHSLFLCPTIA